MGDFRIEKRKLWQSAFDFLMFVLLFLVWLACVCDGAESANFTGSNPEIIRRAEELREERAVYWSGSPLPGDWWQKCPVEWNPYGEPSGATSFLVNQGEVNNFSMEVSGSLNEVLENVLPHEVDHAVRVSLTRRPIGRFFDEGSAGLAESSRFKEFLRSQARLSLNDPSWLGLIDATQYPQNSRDVGRLYAVGFSVCEFLADRSGPEQLLRFQTDPRPPSQKLQAFYQLTPGGLSQEWAAWFQGRLTPEEAVVVETSPGCAPCDRFKADYQRGAFPGFRFEIRNAGPGVSVPRFKFLGATKTGYLGPVDLKTWLTSVKAISILPQPYVRQGETPQPQGAQTDPIVEALADWRSEKERLLADISDLKKNIGEFREAGIIGKVKNLIDLKGDVESLKESSSGLRSDLSTIRESMNTPGEDGEKIPWYQGLWLGFLGVVKRRFLNGKALT